MADLSFQAAHAVEDAVLPDADQCSVAELRQRVQREIRLVDPDGAAGRHDRARCTRKVSHPRPQPDGMASMWLVLDAADAIRVDGVLTHAAQTARALGDDRTLDQLRADGLRDLVVGDVPESDGPAFEVHLSPGLPVPPEPKRSWNGATFTDPDGVVLTRPVEPIPVATLTPLDDTATAAAAGVDRPSSPSGAPDAPTTTEPDSGNSAVATTPRTPTRATAPVGARRGCTRCSGRPGAEVRVTIPASTLLGLDDQPAHLDGHAPTTPSRQGSWRSAGSGSGSSPTPSPTGSWTSAANATDHPPPWPNSSAPATERAQHPGAGSRRAAASSTTPRSSTLSRAPTPTRPWVAPTPTTSDRCATGTTA